MTKNKYKAIDKADDLKEFKQEIYMVIKFNIFFFLKDFWFFFFLNELIKKIF